MTAMNVRRDVARLNETPVALTVGDTIVYRVCTPIKVVRFGLYVTTAIADAAGDGWVYALDRRITPGSDTGRVEMSRITGAAVEGQAAGKVLERSVGTASTVTGSSVLGTQGTGLVTGGQVDGHVCNVGDEIVFEVINAAATAGAGIPFFEYIVLGMPDGTQTDRVTKTA